MAACAILACVIASNYHGIILYCCASAIASILIFCFFKKLRPIFIPALFIFLLFSLLYSFRSARPAELPEEKLIVHAVVCEKPMDQEDKHRTVLTLDRCVINSKPVDYRIRLYVYKNHLGYETGDELKIDTAKLTVPSGVTNPDGFDFNAYLWRSNTALTATANADDITLIAKHASLKRSLQRVQNRLAEICDAVFDESSDVVKAMLLGDRSSLSDSTYDDFSATGISHIIALSGLHVSALVILIEFVLRKLRLARSLRYAVTIVFLILYTVMTGASNSTVRALLMYMILCITRLCGYRSDTITRLCLALLIQLGVNPLLIHDNGFILSYTTVAAILCFADVYTFAPAERKRPLRTVMLSARTSFSVQVVSFPLLAGMFYEEIGRAHV